MENIFFSNEGAGPITAAWRVPREAARAKLGRSVLAVYGDIINKCHDLGANDIRKAGNSLQRILTKELRGTMCEYGVYLQTRFRRSGDLILVYGRDLHELQIMEDLSGLLTGPMCWSWDAWWLNGWCTMRRL